MKKIKKIKIRVNGNTKTIKGNMNLSKLMKILKIPIKKVAIELNLLTLLQYLIEQTLIQYQFC